MTLMYLFNVEYVMRNWEFLEMILFNIFFSLLPFLWSYPGSFYHWQELDENKTKEINKRIQLKMAATKYNNLHGQEKQIPRRAQCTTFRYFPLCCGGFSPANFLSNFPPLAVAVAAIPANLASSSYLTWHRWSHARIFTSKNNNVPKNGRKITSDAWHML